ncbi:MAG: hypothetical protein J0M37_01835 [Ignavibacteria bacterium]|nr:hypothetical protein [Ignavibacteria bacterium]
MYKYLLILLFLAPFTFSQSIPEKFIDALIYDKSEIINYISAEERILSNRLGIEYTGVNSKILIGYELPDEIKSGIISGKYKYELKEQPLSDNYKEVIFNVSAANYSRKYYFNNGFVTNGTYHSGFWEKQESKYFTFRIEEPRYFNDYCIKRLDQFVDMIADTLGFTIAERRILEKEKIGYIFCKDEASVEKITGFKAKGMAMLGTDEVVTSYQTHFHEVAHILINYKLKKLGLYTLPFFMEGFAVAVGGRGGMAPRVVTDLGYYLQKSAILTYDSIITNDGFYNNDASMSYSVAGLYNSFLLNELGGKKYLELYKKANGDLEYVKNIEMNSLRFPKINNWNVYLYEYNKNPDLNFIITDTSKPSRVGNIGYVPIFKKDKIKFFVSYYQFIGFDKLNETENNYTSRLFLSMFPKDSLSATNPPEIGIFVDSVSVKVVNFFNDEIIVNYLKNLSYSNEFVPIVGNVFEFFIKKDILIRFNNNGFVLSGEILETYLDIYEERWKK